MLFLGTSAAEGIPGVFCNCKLCQRAISAGGKNLRHRSSALVNDELLLELSPDFPGFRIKYALDVAKLKAVLVTHTHQDHFSPQYLSYNCPSFAENAVPLKLFMSPYAAEQLKGMKYEKYDFFNYIEIVEAQPYERYSLGSYAITPLEASHNVPQSLLYLIEHEGKTMLYGTDTGAILPRAQEFLSGKKLDIVCLDATAGRNHGKPQRHLGFSDIIEIKEKFIQTGCCDGATLFFATHFTHFTGMLHEEIEEFFAPYGIRAAYDGLIVEK